MGCKENSYPNRVKKTIKKILTKIGMRYQHTNTRLKELQVLNLEDELKLLRNKIHLDWISSTFYAHLFCTKAFFSSYVLAKKQTLLYKKLVRKMLMKLTPRDGRRTNYHLDFATL